MSYLDKPASGNGGDDDFWGTPGRRYWKWTTVGQVLEAVVRDRTETSFPNDPDKPKKVLIVDASDGEWYVTVSQVDLVIKMAASKVTVGTKFRATYVRDERTDKGYKKVFDLEILSDGQANAA